MNENEREAEPLKKHWNPALIVGIAIIVLWGGVWLIGYLMGFQGDPDTFMRM